jgi:hypothetical protein
MEGGGQKLGKHLKSPDTQTVVNDPVALVLLGCFLETLTLRSQPWAAESASSVEEEPQEVYITSKFEKL